MKAMMQRALRSLEDRRTRRRLGVTALGLAVVAGGAAAWVYRPMPKPDAATAAVETMAEFVTRKEFNTLPARDRLNYMLEMLDRLRTFDQEDAAELAEFVAEVNYNVRQQVEENMRLLVVDLMSESAVEYAELPPHERGAFLDQWLLEMDKLGDRINDRQRDVSDEDRLVKMNEQAQRDTERAREQSRALQPDRVEGFFEFYNEQSDSMGAVQRGQVARFLRDMSRHVRGESLDDG